MEEEDKIKATIFYHLRRKRIIGAKHTHFNTLKQGFPVHLGKEVEKVSKDLVKQNYLITKPTNYGLQVSLNKDKLKEIEDFIFKIIGFKFN